jgi:abortive infection bacteriophage resistance protein
MGNEDVNLLGKYVNTVNEIRNLCWLLLRGSGNKH